MSGYHVRVWYDVWGSVSHGYILAATTLYWCRMQSVSRLMGLTFTPCLRSISQHLSYHIPTLHHSHLDHFPIPQSNNSFWDVSKSSFMNNGASWNERLQQYFVFPFSTFSVHSSGDYEKHFLSNTTKFTYFSKYYDKLFKFWLAVLKWFRSSF